ncbi:MAG: hypothetical protein ACJAS1_004985 [Oleiphilaceae bacterium]|jgi:hypothetical protein
MLHIGFIIFSVFIGFTIGASNSPVVGHFLTAIFGLVGAIIGTEYLSSDRDKSQISKKFVGVCLTLSSISLFIGLISGDFYRNSGQQEIVSIPWEGKVQPSTTKEALDWLVVRASLISLGYSQSDVSKIYDIRVKEIDELKKVIEKEKNLGTEFFEQTQLYNDSSPYHSMLPEAKKASVGSRGPASIN